MPQSLRMPLPMAKAVRRILDPVMEETEAEDRQSKSPVVRSTGCSPSCQHKPKARTLLELACGTGAILKIPANDYDVVGLDQSPQMLSIARKKLPRVRFYRRDMVRFDLGKKFDVIICVFDSINHVLKFAEWQKIFRNAARHLEDDGLFLFDINTQAKLERLMRAPTRVHEFGRIWNLLTSLPAAKESPIGIFESFSISGETGTESSKRT